MNARSLAIRSVSAALCLAAAAVPGLAQADNCGLFTPVATDVAQWTTVNGPVVVDHRNGSCQGTAQSASDSIHVIGADLQGNTSADWGLLTAHGVVDSAAQPDHGVLATYGSYLGDGYVARSDDTITALTDAQLHFVSVFDYSGSFSGTVTATSGAWMELRVSGPQAAMNVVQQTSAGPGGSAHQVFTADVFLPAGVTLNLRTTLGAVADGSANWLGATGHATVDASYALTIDTITGQITTGSGHSYQPAAVPEPGSAALLAAGLLVLVGWRRRKP